MADLYAQRNDADRAPCDGKRIGHVARLMCAKRSLQRVRNNSMQQKAKTRVFSRMTWASCGDERLKERERIANPASDTCESRL